MRDFLSLLKISSGGTSYSNNLFSKEFEVCRGAGSFQFKPGSFKVLTGFPNCKMTICSVSSTIIIVDKPKNVIIKINAIDKFFIISFLLQSYQYLDLKDLTCSHCLYQVRLFFQYLVILFPLFQDKVFFL